jgi:hypothetical protein
MHVLLSLFLSLYTCPDLYDIDICLSCFLWGDYCIEPLFSKVCMLNFISVLEECRKWRHDIQHNDIHLK